MGAGTAKDRVGRIEEAQRLRERGLSYPQIAAQMGVGIATAHRWVNHEQYERDRGTSRDWKSRNRDHKLAYDREYDRTHRATCAQCGAPRSRRVNADLCAQCVAERAQQRANRIVELYEQGVSLAAIASEFGCSRGTISVDLDRLRKNGRVGYRNRGYGEGVSATR